MVIVFCGDPSERQQIHWPKARSFTHEDFQGNFATQEGSWMQKVGRL